MQSESAITTNEAYSKILNAQKMTPERLRMFPGFEGVNEHEANQVIETLESFCAVIVKHLSKKESNEES